MNFLVVFFCSILFLASFVVRFSIDMKRDCQSVSPCNRISRAYSAIKQFLFLSLAFQYDITTPRTDTLPRRPSCREFLEGSCRPQVGMHSPWEGTRLSKKEIFFIFVYSRLFGMFAVLSPLFLPHVPSHQIQIYIFSPACLGSSLELGESAIAHVTEINEVSGRFCPGSGLLVCFVINLLPCRSYVFHLRHILSSICSLCLSYWFAG